MKHFSSSDSVPAMRRGFDHSFRGHRGSPAPTLPAVLRSHQPVDVDAAEAIAKLSSGVTSATPGP
jgi:hypothetical protein